MNIMFFTKEVAKWGRLS